MVYEDKSGRLTDLMVVKRRGDYQPFDSSRIGVAVGKAFNSCQVPVTQEELSKIQDLVVSKVLPLSQDDWVKIETVQDQVENALLELDYKEVAVHYIRYREQKRQRREKRKEPDKQAVADYIHVAKYSRFLPEKKRREIPSETVDRRKEQDIKRWPQHKAMIDEAFTFVYDDRIMPSMRSLQFGGRAIELNNNRIYNCSFTLVDRIEAFSEAFHLLLSGCGVGYSVQFHHVKKLPTFKQPNRRKVKHFEIPDTIIGWAEAVQVLIESYVNGSEFIEFAYDLIRGEGTPLKTSGGKAPGHLPLKKCLEQLRTILDGAAKKGRQLRPIECHDMMCHIALAVLSGGIRRSSLICLFSWEDGEMMRAKSGDNFSPWVDGKNYHRVMANNSAVIWRKDPRGPKAIREVYERVLQEANAEFGEPGFYFSSDPDYGTNPCGEIGLNPTLIITPEVKQLIKEWETETGLLALVHESTGKPFIGKEVPVSELLGIDSDKNCLKVCFEGDQWRLVPNAKTEWRRPKIGEVFTGFGFCNLCEINGSTVTGDEDFYQRCKAAATIGTMQAAYTNFVYLKWPSHIISRREALLGIGITGIMDQPGILLDPEILRKGAEIVNQTNYEVARILGIRPAARNCTVKPSGTSSLRFGGCGNGIHGHKARRTIRNILANVNEAPFQFFKKYNPHMCQQKPDGDWVISFPMQVSETAILDEQLNGTAFLEKVRLVYENWVKPGTQRPESSPGLTHNVSNTVTIMPGDQQKVLEYLWEHRDEFAAVSFISWDGDVKYPFAPYQRVTDETLEAQWLALIENYTPVPWDQMVEEDDSTDHTSEAACVAGVCSLT